MVNIFPVAIGYERMSCNPENRTSRFFETETDMRYGIVLGSGNPGMMMTSFCSGSRCSSDGFAAVKASVVVRKSSAIEASVSPLFTVYRSTKGHSFCSNKRSHDACH